MDQPRYDEVARWYDDAYATSEAGVAGREIVLRLLGDGPGRLLDVGCGGGAHMVEFAERRWTTTGVDVSEEQLALARERGCDVALAPAEHLPFDDESFDAVVSMWTHTDVDDFPTAVSEMARVLKASGTLVYIGVHPCFAGPHSRYRLVEEVPLLYPGYGTSGRFFDEAPGISSTGIRAKVGAMHLPLASFLQAFLDAGLRLDRFEEAGRSDYPWLVALRWIG